MSPTANKAASALIGLVGGVILGVLTTIGFAWSLSTRAAAAVMAPMEQKLGEHLASVQARVPQMEAVAKRLEARDRKLTLALAALCEATPRAAEKCLRALQAYPDVEP